MEGIDDIPKYVRYDFFTALMGIAIVYFLYTNELVRSNIKILVLFTVIGAISFVYGLIEMKRNYNKDKKYLDLKRQFYSEKINFEMEKIRA